jgi:hypothetical protein
MKAITIAQPWASLVVHGLKHLETRRWSSRHRGPLAIHAARKIPTAGRMLCHQQPYRTLLGAIGFASWLDLPRGQVMGLVELTGCARVEELGVLPALERLLGDFSPGQWAWSLADPRPLPAPIPWCGRLWTFDVPDSLLVDSRCA